ncbi:hypothetical protein ACFFX1_52715 [Dactylosporangium sucinum]|uniref:Secreted protein n=1 Tax=Dactylosporangium sucinum TaxID=1424081 RepID=A0A917UFR6_9ACTN|nr:hypothetical protein [Dactylosporangium sucinum]GGM89579.1 hypothetical protein GCM10007977_109500 [Dactylosporangium sucinum]
MSGLWEQAPAIIGVAAGALLSFVLSAVADRSRWRRDAAIRWDPQRMTVYAEYATAVRDMYQVVLAVAARHGYGEGRPRPVADPDAALGDAEADRAARFEAVLLVGDPRTVAAARRWHQAVWHLECFARGRLTGPAEWAAARREFGVARAEYYRAARQDLGIPGGLPRTSTPAWKAALAPPPETPLTPPE